MTKAIQVIDNRRKELGLSVAEICRIASIPEATYRNMVSGRSLAEPFPTIRALVLAVGMTLDELISLMDDEASPKTTAALNKIAQTPATTEEVDTGLNVIARTIENSALNYQTELKLLREHFERLIDSKDAQFQAERKALKSAVNGISLVCAALTAALCVSLFI